ncbi:uncharacterized protein LOC111031833 [Myzus persicae]|uniref:uncharacterized protein LOC111031833 n=1 Tax=Myzus persicae TaxID=13164 RepID=UPI000B931684|nr:uncharacterized protein LOC111031833 [Myzus persicae]
MGCVYLCSLVFRRPLGEKIKSFVFKRRVMNVLIPLALSVFLLNQNYAWFINHKNSEGIEKSNLKSIWDLLYLDKEILERNIPKDILNKKKVKSSDIFSSLMKRTQTSLTPYESIDVMSDLKQFFDNISANVKQMKENQQSKYNIQRKYDTSYPGNYFRGRKPSDNVRNFVRNDDGESYRGTNNHDPGILWTGLGKKKRR